MILGKKVNLKAIEPEDLPQLMKWRNLPDFRKHFREYREISSVMQEDWYKNTVLNDRNTIMFSIYSSGNDELIGCSGLCYINWIHRHAELSLYIGYEEEYIDDYGYAEEAVQLLANYVFNELNLHKIWTEIYEFDLKKMALYEKLGFLQDGFLRDNYFYDGRWWGSIILSLIAGQYRKQN